LEWNEYAFDASKGAVCDDGSDSEELIESPLQLRPVRSIRRSRSCPEQFLVADAAKGVTGGISKPGLQRARTATLPCKEMSQGKVYTADFEAWGDDHTSPGASGANGSNGSLDEEDGSEDMPIEPWSRKGPREYLDEDKWNSPTSYSGRSPKSRRDFGRDRDFFDGGSPKDGKGAKRGVRDYDSGSGGKASVLTLRGLPFQTTEAEVVNFIEEAGCKQWLANVSRPVCLLSNPQGRPSGYAEIQLARSSDFHEVRGKLHMRFFGQRYVEVLPLKQTAPQSSRADRYDGDRNDRDRRDRSDRGRSWRR